MAKKCLILHSPLAEDSPPDELDVLLQADFFSNGLKNLGFNAEVMTFPVDMLQAKKLLEELQPYFIINLVETLFGDGRLLHFAPFLFDHCKIPYSGCSAHSLYVTSHKILSKELMILHGIVTPEYFEFSDLKGKTTIEKAYMVKSLWEHASFGLNETGKLLYYKKEELLFRFKNEAQPDSFFCEEYIHGREFNLSILGGENPQILPPAEIQFHYPDEKPRILGYKAKWDEESFEFKNTIRTFEFDERDTQLLLRLKEIALQCWQVFKLRGYARVDFRVDQSGNIFVLEINANPCISPDSGFVAAAAQAGISQTEIVKRIVDDIFIS